MEKDSKKFASAEQKLRLIHLVEADPQLKSGKFSNTFTKNDAKKRWVCISEELNSITGAKKTWEEWRKTWQDRKAHAKKKFASLRRQASLTGGGPPPDPPTLEESLIINCFDQQSLVGHTDCQESKVKVIDLSLPGSSIDEDVGRPKIVSPHPGSSKHEDGRPIIDLSQLENNTDSSQHENTTQHEDVLRATLPKVPNVTGKRRRTVAQRRLQDGLNAAESLNRNLKEKNEIKKKFYEDYIKLMTEQTKALVDIAAALNK